MRLPCTSPLLMVMTTTRCQPNVITRGWLAGEINVQRSSAWENRSSEKRVPQPTQIFSGVGESHTRFFSGLGDSGSARLVEGVPDMQISVGVGRAVVQNVFIAGVVLQQLLVDPLLVPKLLQLGLPLHGIRALEGSWRERLALVPPGLQQNAT